LIGRITGEHIGKHARIFEGDSATCTSGAGPRFRHRGAPEQTCPGVGLECVATSWASRWRPLAVCGWYSPGRRTGPVRGKRRGHGRSARWAALSAWMQNAARSAPSRRSKCRRSPSGRGMDGPLQRRPRRSGTTWTGRAPSGLRRRTEALPEQAGQGAPESPQAEHFSASGGVADQASATASACSLAGSLAAPIRGRFVSSREGSALVSMSYFLTSPPAPSGSVRGRRAP
jgi:hypothetical protein